MSYDGSIGDMENESLQWLPSSTNYTESLSADEAIEKYSEVLSDEEKEILVRMGQINERPSFESQNRKWLHVSKAPLNFIKFYGREKADALFNAKGTYRKHNPRTDSPKDIPGIR